jgi:hypothetical protein
MSRSSGSLTIFLEFSSLGSGAREERMRVSVGRRRPFEPADDATRVTDRSPRACSHARHLASTNRKKRSPTLSFLPAPLSALPLSHSLALPPARRAQARTPLPATEAPPQPLPAPPTSPPAPPHPALQVRCACLYFVLLDIS